MTGTKVLEDLQNASLPTRKVQRTYGKKSKATVIHSVAKDIFVTASEIETGMENLSISNEDDLLTSRIKSTRQTVDTAAIPKRILPENKPISERTDHERRPCPEPLHNSSTPIVQHESKKTEQKSSSRYKQRTPAPKIKPTPTNPLLPHLDSLDTEQIQALVLKYSDRAPLTFDTYGKKISKACTITKIGEGSYSSVFALRPKSITPSPNASQTSTTSTSTTSSQPSIPYSTTILKLMPILLPSTASPTATPSTQTTPPHIAAELATLSQMDSHHGFLRYRGLTILHGPWHPSFLSAFHAFSSAHPKKALNEDPTIAFPSSQYYALIEMDDAGRELADALKRPSDFQMWDCFWSVAVCLANAEGEAGFEHRDLHVSNVCVWPDVETGLMDVSEDEARSWEEWPAKVLGLSGLGVTLIDYTFSRARMGDGVNFREFVVEGDGYEVLLKKMARDAKKIGNSGEKFEDRMQQLTYAKVAKCVQAADAAAAAGEGDGDIQPWERFVPRSNVYWLGYLVTCLLSRAGKTAKTKYVTGSNELSKQVQDELRRRLIELKALLSEDIDAMPLSADDILRIGVEKKWLSRDEIEFFKDRLEAQS